MNKTIYVRDEDLALFDQAERISGKTISPLITELLRKYVAENVNKATPKERLKSTAEVLRAAADDLEELSAIGNAGA